MKAIVYSQHGLPPEDPHSLHEMDLPKPTLGSRDILVRVQAISVNPLDTKIRRTVPTRTPRVLGWDAVGVVEAIGGHVTLFKVADRVFYAGAINRPGTNAEYHVVDERIVGHAPQTLDDAKAAALPLTSITAWELLFDRLGIAEGAGEGQALLIVGAAGGVGSILIQLARQLTKLTVIGTASRDQTQSWIRDLGVHHAIDHSRPMLPQLKEIGVPHVQCVASLTHTEAHYSEIIEALAPQGRLALIDDPVSLDISQLKRKCLSLHWESMFTRSIYQTDDMIRQHELLERVGRLVDAGKLRSTLGVHLGRITAENLRRAHALIEGQRSQGKIVLEGF